MDTLNEEVKNIRKPDHDVLPLFVNRWSPRALSGESISDEELNSLFEAARWAPSAFNNQEWRFVYAKRDTPHWDKFFGFLAEFNQMWCKNASVLIIVLSRTKSEFQDQPAPTHSLDAGAAWMSLALQAAHKGLVAHGMSAFDFEKVKKELAISDLYKVEAMVAVGKRGKKEDLPEALQEKEAPSTRKSVKEIAFEGEFDSSK